MSQVLWCLVVLAAVTTARPTPDTPKKANPQQPSVNAEYVQIDDIIEPNHPLWPGSLYTYEDRDKAILKGIAFLEKQSKDDSHFLQHARDYMLGMKLVAQSSHNRQIVASASRIGKEMSTRWRDAHTETDPSKLSNDELRLLTGDIFNGKRYGVECNELLAKVKAVMQDRKFSSFFTFNPIVSAPQDFQDPKTGRIVSRWEGWQNALIFAYVLKELDISTLEGNGLKLFIATLNWLPDLKPHTHVMDTANFIPNLSAVLQLVYTLSDYEFLSVDRETLPDEYALLEQSLPIAIDYFQSVEAVGEIVDCLKTFGDKESSPNIQRGITYLLAEQNADGSWGGAQEKQLGIEHHTTIVALWGLRERMDHGKGPNDNDVVKKLEEIKGKKPSQVKTQMRANNMANNLAQLMQLMGMQVPGGLANLPQIPGLPGIPAMPHNPFSYFQTQYGGNGNAPVFSMDENQKAYLEAYQKQQQEMAKAYEQMHQQMQAQQIQAQQQYQQMLIQQQKQMEEYQKQAQAQAQAQGAQQQGGADAQQQQQPQQQQAQPGMGLPAFPYGFGLNPMQMAMGLGMPGMPGMPGVPGFPAVPGFGLPPVMGMPGPYMGAVPPAFAAQQQQGQAQPQAQQAGQTGETGGAQQAA